MKIIFTKSSEKELASLEKPLQRKIFNKIKTLSEDPYPYGSQKLEGGKGYRLRVGNYRVVYEVFKDKLIIVVIKIAHRKDVYR